jgi:alpha-pyrone synthase
MDPSVDRSNISFMGCAAGVCGLKSGRDFVSSHKGKYALVCAIDLSSPHVNGDFDIGNLIQTTIFADGCGAAILIDGTKEEQQGFKIENDCSYLMPETEDGIKLGISNSRVTCTFSKNLSNYIQQGMPVFLKTILKSNFNKEDIKFWGVHPGGARILESVQKSLDLKDEEMKYSRSVLNENGNQLSSAIFYVLERIFKECSKDDLIFAFSFAPGLGIEGLLIRKQ